MHPSVLAVHQTTNNAVACPDSYSLHRRDEQWVTVLPYGDLTEHALSEPTLGMAPINSNLNHSIHSVFTLPWPSPVHVVGQCLLHCTALFALAGVFLYLLLQIAGWRKYCVKGKLTSEQDIPSSEKNRIPSEADEGVS